MPLTGQAKTDYQRGYMRRRRSNTPLMEDPPKVLDPEPSVRPKQLKPVRPKRALVRPANISDSQWAYIQYRADAT